MALAVAVSMMIGTSVPLHGADDGKAVFFRHVEVEHDEIGDLLGDALAQARSAVAQRDLEAMQFQIVAHHLACGRLVIDHTMMCCVLFILARPRAAAGWVKVAPRPGPGLSAGNAPAVQVDDAFDDRETKPG